MDKKLIIEKIEADIKNRLLNESSGHDWWHIKRVLDLAITINKKENKDEFIISMIALLHDLFDEKFAEGDVSENLRNYLNEMGMIDDIDSVALENIIYSVANLGFKGGFNKVDLSDEGKIVQDADRIDAIGAIGIARCFAYNGKKGNPIYDPEMGIIELKNESEYRNIKRHAINHFYEKLLKLKDSINTNFGKIIAEERTKFMQMFLDEFYAEWDGRK